MIQEKKPGRPTRRDFMIGAANTGIAGALLGAYTNAAEAGPVHIEKSGILITQSTAQPTKYTGSEGFAEYDRDWKFNQAKMDNYFGNRAATLVNLLLNNDGVFLDEMRGQLRGTLNPQDINHRVSPRNLILLEAVLNDEHRLGSDVRLDEVNVVRVARIRGGLPFGKNDPEFNIRFEYNLSIIESGRVAKKISVMHHVNVNLSAHQQFR